MMKEGEYSYRAGIGWELEPRQGMVSEAYHFDVVNRLEIRIKILISKHSAENTELRELNDELRGAVEKLRDKLIEQDSVIKKIMGNNSGRMN
jgi:hypothetical protein